VSGTDSIEENDWFIWVGEELGEEDDEEDSED
jgi:hypothetical protein